MSQVGSRLRRAASWNGWLKLGAIVTTVGVLIGFWYTAQGFKETVKANELNRQTAITTRFTTAVEALDKEGLNARIGGIYSLEQLAIDSPGLRGPVLAILGSFIKANASMTYDFESCDTTKTIADDVTAALTVIRRRPYEATDELMFDRVCLPGANLTGSDLRLITFMSSNLTRASFDDAQIRKLGFMSTNLDNSSFIGVDLTDVWFQYVKLNRSFFTNANLTRTQFIYSDLARAELSGTELTDTCFIGSDLSAAEFSRIGYPATKNIDSATFIADTHNGTVWPSGFTPPASIDLDKMAIGPTRC